MLSSVPSGVDNGKELDTRSSSERREGETSPGLGRTVGGGGELSKSITVGSLIRSVTVWGPEEGPA